MKLHALFEITFTWIHVIHQLKHSNFYSWLCGLKVVLKGQLSRFFCWAILLKMATRIQIYLYYQNGMLCLKLHDICIFWIACASFPDRASFNRHLSSLDVCTCLASQQGGYCCSDPFVIYFTCNIVGEIWRIGQWILRFIHIRKQNVKTFFHGYTTSCIGQYRTVLEEYVLCYENMCYTCYTCTIECPYAHGRAEAIYTFL